MKKILAIVATSLFVLGGIGIYIWNAIYGDKDEPKGNTTVEALIKQDSEYFYGKEGKVVFFESQVLLDKPFNEGSKFVAVEVINVFEQQIGDSCNIYQFKHTINFGGVDINVIKGGVWCEDVIINPDSLGMTFEQAYEKAKQSDLTPSKSCYMVLRNPLGPVRCNPQFIIGNPGKGIMYVDSKTGDVIDKDPAREAN